MRRKFDSCQGYIWYNFKMNINDIVMIINLEEHEKKAARIIKVHNDQYTVLLMNDNVEIQVKSDNLKKKKMCSCGLSQNKYFCDASHMNA